MRPRPTSFVVLTAGRSGSTFIRSALVAHPHVVCFGEIFEDPQPDDLADKDIVLAPRRAREAATGFARRAFSSAMDHRATGFKLKYYHFAGTRLREYLCGTRARVIHSRRRNVVAQSLSLPLASAHEFGYGRWDGDHEGLYHRPVAVDIDDVIYRCEENTRGSELLERAFRPHVPMLDLYYDDFCHTDSSGTLTRQQQVDELLGFIGVATMPLKTEMQKQRQLPYTYLIKNYSALRVASLRRHPEWEPHFLEMENGALVV